MGRPGKLTAYIMVLFLVFSAVFAGKAAKCHARQTVPEKKVCIDKTCPMHKAHNQGSMEGDHSSHDHEGHAAHHGQAHDEGTDIKSGSVDDKDSCSTVISCSHHKTGAMADTAQEMVLSPACAHAVHKYSDTSIPVSDKLKQSLKIPPSERPPSA